MKEAYLFTVMTAMAASWCAMATFSDFWSAGLMSIALLAFPIACAFTVLRGREASPFLAGCGYGIANAVGSTGLAYALARFITGNQELYLPPLIGFGIGVPIWGLAAIPTCALFRRLFARLRKD